MGSEHPFGGFEHVHHLFHIFDKNQELHQSPTKPALQLADSDNACATALHTLYTPTLDSSKSSYKMV